MRFLTILLALLTTCCSLEARGAPRQSPVVFIDSAFTQTERGALTAAMLQWSVATGHVWGEVRLCTHGEDCDKVSTLQPGRVVFVRHLSTDKFVAGEDENTLAFVDDIPGHRINFIQDRIIRYDLSLENVALHELGHILGLYHIPYKASLMFPSIQGRACIDWISLLEYAALNDVPMDELQYNCPTDLD